MSADDRPENAPSIDSLAAHAGPPLPDAGPLRLSWRGRTLVVELDHGRANEMGSDALAGWEAVCGLLERGAARALLTFSRRRSAKGAAVFISGADVTERAGWDEARVKAHVRRQRDLLARLRRAPVFHVAVVHGVAFGWGTEFLITADYRVATPEARFALPETGLGIIPGAGGTSELWSLIGVSQALRLGMTGEELTAAAAVEIGLVQEVVDDVDAGLARAEQLCRAVGRRSPTAVAMFKRALLESVGSSGLHRAELEARAYERCVDAGEAAIGRASFKEILSGGVPGWGPLRLPEA
jgi:enoyl-CoA hydratase/carnithine racemase